MTEGRVWHFHLRSGPYSAPRVHASGHVRPKAVTFATRGAALNAWRKSLKREIDSLTRQIKTCKNAKRLEWLTAMRLEYRRYEAAAKAME